MKMQHALTPLAPNNWVVDQVVVFDWFDGPRQGVARLAKPECEFAFALIAERHNSDELDDRLFRLSELPAGSVTRVLDAIHSLGTPASVVWVPVWKFASEEERLRADQEIDRILSEQKPTGLVIYSPDMITILGCWQNYAVRGQVHDWFLELGIP